MKKLTLIIIALFIGAISVNAQGQFRAGLSGGIPIGDAGDLATFAIAADIGYLFEVSDSFKVGPTAGYYHSFGDTIDVGGTTFDFEDIQFIPIGAAVRYGLAPIFTLGADVGYALGINDGNDGGFYYFPKAQFDLSETIDIVVGFRGISEDGGSFNSILAGLEFVFVD